MNILKLHRPEDTEKSSVRAFGGVGLNEIFDRLCKIYVGKNKIIYKSLAKEIFKVNPNSLQSWRGKNKQYKNGHPIPLWALQKILELNKMEYNQEHKEIVKNISNLQCGRVCIPVKAQIYLTPELAKLCGAHAADGSLYQLKNRGCLSSKWDLGDQEKQNIVEARKWIRDVFGFEPVFMQKGKMSYTWTNMQVISRYLVQIFDFPIGRKTDIVSMPKILEENDNRLLEKLDQETIEKLQVEFAKEVINFDGHSTLSGRVVQVVLGSNSKRLLEDVRNIFKKENIDFHIYDTKILTTSFEESRKLYSLGLFRGQKRKKFKKLILQHARKAEKQP